MLRSLWANLPATHSPMQATGDEKYHQQRGEPNAELLRAHLRGATTLAAPMVGSDGLARAAAIDTDTGGQEPLRRLLTAATARGYSAFVTALTSDEHDGGHLWLRPFEDASDPARLRTLCRLLLADAGQPLTTELWPNGLRGDIRLPFGLHVRCGRRGTLLLPDGEVFDLDTPEGLLGGLEAVSQLPLNDTSRLPEPEPEPVAAPRPRRAEGAGPTRIEGLNQASPEELAALLVEHFGCRIARTVPSGIMLHCGCDKHAHGDRKPSLRVYQGRNGKALVSSYSPACKWRGEKHHATDYAAVYCEAHGLSYRDLVAPARPANYPAPPTDADQRQTDPAELARRNAEAERKRRARVQATTATLQAVRDRAAEDASLAPGTAGYKVLYALLEIAGAKDWCRPSVARLVEQVGCSERTVQRALAYLEGRYIITEERTTEDGTPWRGGPNTAKRTFLPVPLHPVPTPQSEQGGVTRPDEPAEPAETVAPVIDNKLVLDSYPVACEGGVTGASEPEPLDEAGWDALMATSPEPVSDDVAAELAIWPCCWPEEEPESVLPAAEPRPTRAPEAVAFAGGCSFDPSAAIPLRSCAEDDVPLDRQTSNWTLLVEHWRQLDARRATDPDQPSALVSEELVPVLRSLVDAAHAERINKLNTEAWRLLGKARKTSTSEKQRRVLRRQGEAILEQVRALQAERWPVPAEVAARLRGIPTAQAAQETAGPQGKPPLTSAGVIQSSLFIYDPPTDHQPVVPTEYRHEDEPQPAFAPAAD